MASFVHKSLLGLALRVVFVFVSVAVGFMSWLLMGRVSRAQSSPSVPSVELKVCERNYSDSNFDFDVACRCRRDQCRLSTFKAEFVSPLDVCSRLLNKISTFNYFDECIAAAYGARLIGFNKGPKTFRGSYMCIDGESDINDATFRLGMEQQAGQDLSAKYANFTDTNIYKALGVAAPENLTTDKSGVYLDSFANDATRAAIPKGSVCKKDRETGIAYWYYPTYFDVLEGKDPSGGALGRLNLIGVGGACKDVLFSSRDLFGAEISGTQTFFGCLPNSPNGLVAFLVRLISGLALIITLLIVIINLIQIIANSTNPDVVSRAQKKMTGAIITLIVMLLILTILNFIGVQVIGFGGGGPSIFSIFTGG